MEENMERAIYPVYVGDGLLEPRRSSRRAPPKDFRLKIQSFSLLSELLGVNKPFLSSYFEVGGFKWVLALYPEGDGRRAGNSHVSMYLLLSEANHLPRGLGIEALFTFFIYDQHRDNYLMIQDSHKTTRIFSMMSNEWGFAKPSNGFLVNDCCLFGAEVTLPNPSPKTETVRVFKEPGPASNLEWLIPNFLDLNQETLASPVVTYMNYAWHMVIHPRGDFRARNQSLSLYLSLDDWYPIPPDHYLYVKFELAIKDQLGGNHHLYSGFSQFDSTNNTWGCSNLVPLLYLSDPSKGLLVNGTICVEARIQLLTLIRCS